MNEYNNLNGVVGKVRLHNVTLCCVDCTDRMGLAVRAVRASMAGVEFDDVVFCTDKVDVARKLLPNEGVRIEYIDKLDSIEKYSEYMIKGLVGVVRTSHFLIVQWDGFVVNPLAWKIDFLKYDYIGAPWAHYGRRWPVGNGGFSLRSTKLLTALQDDEVVAAHPEDSCICKTYRDFLEGKGIVFAPKNVAKFFSVEDGELTRDIFGFHSPCHFPRVLTHEELGEFINGLDYSVVNRQYFGSLLRELKKASLDDSGLLCYVEIFRKLVIDALNSCGDDWVVSDNGLGVLKALIRYREFGAARIILNKRSKVVDGFFSDVGLWLRMWVRFYIH